jgi:hypothetical protein
LLEIRSLWISILHIDNLVSRSSSRFINALVSVRYESVVEENSLPLPMQVNLHENGALTAVEQPIKVSDI